MQNDPAINEGDNNVPQVGTEEDEGLNTSAQVLDQMAGQSGAAPVEEESDEVALAKLGKVPAQEGANVRLAKSRHKEALPEGLTNIGMTPVMLPNKAQQLAGFFIEDSGVLVGQYRQYKFYNKDKGQKNDQHVTI